MKQTYIWQHNDWPKMYWQEDALSGLLADANRLRGELLGRLTMFGFKEQSDSMLESLTQEIVHSAEIEGERLNRDSVRSSVARQLGLEYDGLDMTDHYVEGVVQVMLDATQHFQDRLTAERLFAWHGALFPTGRSGMTKIKVGDWRQGEEPMQVVSGAFGHQRVHFEAPPSDAVPPMMQRLLDWLAADECSDPLVKAAVAHLWFVTVHPFDDGNGRLCRTVTEMMLSRADLTSRRYYSLSSEILNHRKDYYNHLERAQKGGLDITEWVAWFLRTLQNALQAALKRTEIVVQKARFWDIHRSTPVNERQKKVLNMMLDGFEGKLNSSKWYKINHCSQDTAIRDINDLIAKGILRKTVEGGRSTNYELCSF